MFGFWFWVLTPLAVVLVGAFIYDRRHKNVRVMSAKDAPAASGGTEALGAAMHYRNTPQNNTPGSL